MTALPSSLYAPFPMENQVRSAMIRKSRFEGVFEDDERLYTRNSAPGHTVYGEKLFSQDGIEYREWVPTRSKLAAYIRCGGQWSPFKADSKVLYLGAASGTTASHVADMTPKGTVFCIEISPRSFRDLVPVCETRPNMVPFLADATRPEQYSFGIDRVDVVYQDIAQKGQASIFIKAMRTFHAPEGLLVIKSRSEDVSRPPSELYGEAKAQLKGSGMNILGMVELDPLEKDHAMMEVRSLMRYVYCIAFKNDEFVMVFNPERGGWEMPGGKVEEDESDVDAMEREFREEVGHSVTLFSKMDLGEGVVFAGIIGERKIAGEMDWCAFRSLPEQLSFPAVEYAELIRWARLRMSTKAPNETDAESAAGPA